MPFYLKEKDVISELVTFKSVLIVPCRFCPAASSALNRNEPYIKLLGGSLKTASYEQMIKTLKSDLEKQGIKTGVFQSNLLHQFVLCTWSSKKRQKLLEDARQYEALLVLGCEAAGQTVRDAVKSSSCQVIQGMKTEGLMSVRPRFHLPCNISLELESVTPFQKGNEPISHHDRVEDMPSVPFREQTGDCLRQRAN
jgi:hypothetical protein